MVQCTLISGLGYTASLLASSINSETLVPFFVLDKNHVYL